jgi:putative transposase
MPELCREFDISRKTGYKIFQRYKALGLQGLTDRSRRPFRPANKLPMPIDALIVQRKREHPSWRAPKIREKVRRRHDDVQTPAISTVHAVLGRHDLVTHGRRRRCKAQGTRLSKPLAPNDLWCADYKDEFMLADGRYCYPLTITDFASGYRLSCEALGSTQEACAYRVPARVPRLRPTQVHSHRQWRAVRQRAGVPSRIPFSPSSDRDIARACSATTFNRGW